MELNLSWISHTLEVLGCVHEVQSEIGEKILLTTFQSIQENENEPEILNCKGNTAKLSVEVRCEPKT